MDHIANPTDPTDQTVTNLGIVLEDTNLLVPYEFCYHNQILPRFIPADAALKSFFTTFEVTPHYRVNVSVAPVVRTILDSESANWVLNVTNIGDRADSYQLTIQNLTLGTASLSQDRLALPPKGSTLVTLEVSPLQLGAESFSLLIESLSAPYVNVTRQLQLTVLDDGTVPPLITSYSITDTPQEVIIQIVIQEYSRIGVVELTIDGAPISPSSITRDGSLYTIILQNTWSMATGYHTAAITVWDADADRPSDALATSLEDTFETSRDDMIQFVLAELDQLTIAIQTSSNDCWANPAENKKSAVVNKMGELQEMVASYDFEIAYDKLLHDLKPKLTGLKTDETEMPWGDGIFNNS